jgi:hypothetical protein
MTTGLAHRWTAMLAAAVVLLGFGGWGAAPAYGDRAWIDLGVGDALAFDQPRVTFGLLQPGTTNIVGPNLYNSALLDTGANGLLLGQLAYIWGENYGQAVGGDGGPAWYYELGVAGEELFALLPSYDLIFEGSDTTAEYIVSDVIAMGGPHIVLGSFSAIIGMPAMEGRVTRINLTRMLNWDFIGVDFADTRPAATSHSYHVSMTMLDPVHTGQIHPDDPLPTFSALPMLQNVRAGRGHTLAHSEMLLDTGAQTTIISASMAASLGIDYTGADVLDYLEVGGVGGTVMMPLVLIDHLTLPTSEGVDLIWTDLLVGVLDIPGIGGIFGMNLLTQGYIDAVFGFGGDPAFRDIVLDFTDAQQGVMRLDLFAASNQVQTRPWVIGDFTGDDRIDTADINAFILALTDPTAFAATYPWVDPAGVDPNGDGQINTADINPFIAALVAGALSGSAVIPEPGTLMLLTAGAWLVGRRPRRPRVTA